MRLGISLRLVTSFITLFRRIVVDVIHRDLNLRLHSPSMPLSPLLVGPVCLTYCRIWLLSWLRLRIKPYVVRN